MSEREKREYLVGHYVRHGWTVAQAERAACRPGLNLDRAMKLASRANGKD